MSYARSDLPVCSITMGITLMSRSFGDLCLGKQEVKHAVDCHLHLAMDTDKKSDTYKQRVAEMQKNRFGTSGLFFPYEINSKGIQFSE